MGNNACMGWVIPFLTAYGMQWDIEYMLTMWHGAQRILNPVMVCLASKLELGSKLVWNSFWVRVCDG